MTNGIKPCPFCGIAPTPEPEDEDFDDIPEGLIAVTCNCIESDDYSTRYVCADRWNTRPVEDAINAELAALRPWVEMGRLMVNTYRVFGHSMPCLWCRARPGEDHFGDCIMPALLAQLEAPNA